MRSLLFALLLLVAPLAEAAVVERVVVVVEDELVLASDIDLDLVLTPLDASLSPFWRHPRPDPTERMVEAAILRHLAGDVTYYAPSADEVRVRVDTIREAFVDRGSWQAFLQSWGLDEEGMKGVVRRRLVVERYLARNVPVEPTDEARWHAVYDDMMAGVRPKLRIRYVDAREVE